MGFIIVSATRRRREFNIVSNNHGRTQKRAIFALQTITHLIQYTVFEIQFWSVTCTTAMIRKNFEHFHSFPSSDASDYNG